MGLAASQVHLLMLTTRKADCEYGLSIDSMQKMSLSREMSELSSEYYSKLQSKNIAYYANGKYHKMDYRYLMGNGVDFTHGGLPVKENNSMILADYNGRVVLNNTYASAIMAVTGIGPDQTGKGGTFSSSKIAEIISKIIGYSTSEIQTVIDEKSLEDFTYSTNIQNSITGDVVDYGTNTGNYTDSLKSVVDFYYPIFAAAAVNGWTVQYNSEMNENADYVSDALVSGTFQLMNVNFAGDYDEGTSLTYFITAGLIESRNDSDAREEVTAWYNAEKERITEKETILDLHMDELSTELEAINTEIQSIKSLIDDAIQSVFDWGTG